MLARRLAVRIVMLSAAALAMGCSPGSAAVEGKVRDRSLEAEGAVLRADGANRKVFLVEVPPAEFCDTMDEGAIVDAMELMLSFEESGPKEYAVGGGLSGSLYYSGDDSGNNDWHEAATSGTLTLESISSASAAGRFDLTFPGGALKGTFEAEPCG